MWLLVLAVMLGVIAAGRAWIARSDYGRAMSAMRDDELAFASLGRDAMWMKIAIFALGSGIAGFAGGLYAHYFRFITPEQFEILQSSAILTMVVVGGMRTTWGPVVGAVLLQALPQAITFLNCRRACSARFRACCSPAWCWSSCSSARRGWCRHATSGAAPSRPREEAAPMTGVLEVKKLYKSFDGIVVARRHRSDAARRPRRRPDRAERRRQDLAVQSDLRRGEARCRHACCSTARRSTA